MMTSLNDCGSGIPLRYLANIGQVGWCLNRYCFLFPSVADTREYTIFVCDGCHSQRHSLVFDPDFHWLKPCFVERLGVTCHVSSRLFEGEKY